MKNITKRKYSLTLKLSSIFVTFVFLFGLSFYISGFSKGNGIYLDGCVASFWESIYFSVVSITTLGYGDFTPEGISRIIASFEAIFGLIFVGYSLAQILSLKQEVFLDYITEAKILDTYKDCVAKVVDAKEDIADRRRLAEKTYSVEPIDFIYNRSNPFYPALKALQSIKGYTTHIEKIGQIDLVEKHIERSFHHTEELISFTRKYIIELNNKNVSWHTPRTKEILNQLCNAVDEFVEQNIKHTKYNSSPYKGSPSYTVIINSSISEVRQQCV
jgi:hypothetical protein